MTTESTNQKQSNERIQRVFPTREQAEANRPKGSRYRLYVVSPDGSDTGNQFAWGRNQIEAIGAVAREDGYLAKTIDDPTASVMRQAAKMTKEEREALAAQILAGGDDDANDDANSTDQVAEAKASKKKTSKKKKAS